MKTGHPLLWLEAIILGYFVVINFLFCCGNLLPAPALTRLLESAPETPGRLYRYYSRVNIPSPNSYDAMGTDIDLPTYILTAASGTHKEYALTRSDGRFVDIKKLHRSFIVHGKGACESCPPSASGSDYMSVRFRMVTNSSRQIVSLVGFERTSVKWVDWMICLSVFSGGCIFGYLALSWLWQVHLRDLAVAYCGSAEGIVTLFAPAKNAPWDINTPNIAALLLFPIWLLGLVAVKWLF